MRIISIHIDEFGPLHNRDFDFNSDMAVITGENESGKSTLLLFIKFALYGLSKKAKGVLVPETDKALSRDTSSACGSMTVIHEAILYRIDRQLHKKGKTFSERIQVTEVETGLKCNFGNSPGEFFLGIPVEVFENSCGISQLGCSTVKGEQIGTAIKNLLSSADESIDYQKALKILDAARIKYLHKGGRGGSIYTLTTQKEELQSGYIKAIEDSCQTEQLTADLNKLDDKIAEVSEKQNIADELSSKITLCSVIKLFDKLHEHENEQEQTQKELDTLKSKLCRDGKLLDRKFVAELSSAKSELDIAHDNLKASEEALERARGSIDKKIKDTVENVEQAGGLEGLKAFFNKIGKVIKRRTAASVIFFSTTFAFAALAAFVMLFANITLTVVCAAAAVLSLSAAITFLAAKKSALKRAISKASELGISYREIQAYITYAEKAILTSDQIKCSTNELEASLAIKNRMLLSALQKANDILCHYYQKTEEDKNYFSVAEKLVKATAELSQLCDKYELLCAKLSSLSSIINNISSELSEYNEHQTRRRVSEQILKMTDEEIKEAKKEKSYYELQLKALAEKKTSLERSLIERKYSTQNPFDIAAKLSDVDSELKAQNDKLSSLLLAIDTLEKSSINLRNTIAPKLRALSNGYMNTVTDGKYNSVTISDTLEMSMSEDGFSYPIDSFSTGTKDMAYLALRLSILSILPCDEAPPLLLDETLSMIDDKRAKRLLKMLDEHSKQHGQCILFCCHDRELRLCREADVAFSSIEM